VDAEDQRANDQALLDGSRLLSSYRTLRGVELWVLTEAVGDNGQRASTRLTLPSRVLNPTEALARVVGWRTLDDRPGVLRRRIKRVWLTGPEVFNVVKLWGRMDAERGRSISDAEKLPEPYRAVYLEAYTVARSGLKQH
jgi:hypothetical protein